MDITKYEPTTAIVRFLAKSGIDLYVKKRRNYILKALDEGILNYKSHELHSDEFISCYLATEHALMKASSQSKFNFLLDLFIQGCNSGRLNTEPDSYQETLSIVDELSERELTILYHLYNYERDNGEMEGQLSRSNDHQINYIIEQTKLERILVISLFVRLRRTGLLITYSERNPLRDIMLGGIEIMFISPIANEIKSWILNVIEGSFNSRKKYQ